MKRMCLLLVGLSLLLTPFVQAQVPPDKVLSTFTVTDPDLEISLWASEPLFVNPTCMDIDHKGRVWVCESVNYRHRLHNRPPLRPEGDRIVILEDSKSSGRANKATTFYQSPQILAPLGIAVAKDPVGPGYKVYVCQSPDILLFEDKDGDGKANGPPRKLLSGFQGFDHDHGVHGILIGPDNKLYFSVGDTGVRDLMDKHGKKRSSNASDCRAGTIWRCDLDGQNVELLAHNFRNEYEPCVDSFGTIFVSDNDDDGSQQTRICYVMPGGNYGYHPRGPGQSHWHEEQPGVVPKILRTYFGSPTGMCVYEGTLLAAKYRSQLLHTDAGPRHLRCYHLKPEGAGYAVERDDMVTSTDNWFRPSDVCVGPDGSVYVADWYDPGVGGHGMGDTTRGRIFRVAPRGHRPMAPKVDLDSTEGLTAALASPALSVRYMAMAKLQTLDRVKAEAVLVPAARQTKNVWLRARALWQIGRLHSPGIHDLLADVYQDKDPRFALLALRIEKDFLDQPPDRLRAHANLSDWTKDVINHPSPAVRREALLLLRDVPPEQARPMILELAKRYPGNDRFYLAAIGIAVGQDKARRDVILTDFDRQFPEWNDKLADLIWELRPPQVLPLLEKRLADKTLPAEQRGRIVDIVAVSEELTAGKVLLKSLLTETPREVRERIIDRLKLSLAGKWRPLRQSPELAETITRLLAQPDTRSAALALIGAAEKVDAVAKVADVAGDPRQTPAVRVSAIQTLGLLPSKETVAALERLLSTKPAELRGEAVKALGRLTTPEARAVLQKLIVAADQDLSLRQAAAAGLAGSRPGSAWLLDAHGRQELPEALRPDVARLLRNSPFPDLRNKAMNAFPPPGRIDPKKIPSIASLLPRQGNVARGKQVTAANKDLRCLACHTIRGIGGNVGPDLSMIGKKASRENLFESILYPSKAIADQYLSWVVETKDGNSLTGLIVEDTPDFLTIRDGNAKDTRVAKKDIDNRARSYISIMPSDLLAYMTEDDLVDIVDYLFTLKTPSLALDYWHIIGPFDNGDADAGLDQVFPPEKEINRKSTYPGKSGSVSWRKVKPNDTGYVDLRAFLAGNSDNVVSYLHRDIESPVDQEALVLMGTDDCAKLWVNDKLVQTNRQHRAAAPEQDAVKVQLKKGINKILLKINNGNGEHGFYFTIQSEQELKRLEGK